jgi:hypothetical protein
MRHKERAESPAFRVPSAAEANSASTRGSASLTERRNVRSTLHLTEPHGVDWPLSDAQRSSGPSLVALVGDCHPVGLALGNVELGGYLSPSGRDSFHLTDNLARGSGRKTEVATDG